MKESDEILNKKKPSPAIWDVSDIDRVTMFLHDCRYFNGGLVAPPEIQKYWKDSGIKEPEEDNDIIAP